MEPTKNPTDNSSSGGGDGGGSPATARAAKVYSLKQKVAAESPQLVGRIIEKGFSPSDGSPSFLPVSLPQPTVLPFPVARHRSHGPHWNPAKVEREISEEEMDLDEDEMKYDALACFAKPVKRKEKKGLDLSNWKELINDNYIGNSAAPQIKKRVVKSAPKTSKIEINEINEPIKEDLIMRDMNQESLNEPIKGDLIMHEMNQESIIGPLKEDLIMQEMNQESSQNPKSVSLEEEISAENLALLNEKSAEEIEEAQKEIMEKLNPKMIEMLKRRGKNKSERSDDNSKRKKEKEIKRESFGPPAGDWLESGGKIKNNILWESWSERVEKIRVCRFSLDGEVLGFDSPLEKQNGLNHNSVTERDLIRTEGDPSSVGYTINEAVSLTRSRIPGQRVLALQLLSSILNRALCNLEKNEGFSVKCVDWQAIWAFALGPEPQLPLSLRMLMDDNHDSVVLACSKTILSLLSYDMNESYFEASQKFLTNNKSTCTAPVFRTRPDINQGFIQGGFWKYNTKRSNLLPEFGECENLEGESEKRTVRDDVVVAGQDVAAGLVRMSLVPRICFLLEMDPVQNMEETPVSMLVALARHSPQSADAILRCPNLVQTVAKILRNYNSTAEIIRPAQIKVLVLFKILSKYNKQTCLDFIKNGIFQLATWTWYKDDFTLDKFLNSQKENLKLNTNLIVEQLRFWRVYINYNLCVSHFTDFFSFLCLFLSPPVFQKLTDQNALVEFCSVTSETYLVLQTLAEKLPVLHSKREEKLERESESSWSWSHAVPMVDLALKWLDSKNIPILPLAQETDQTTLSSFLGVFSSIFHMLNTILQKISPKETDSVPFLPDFVPRIGLALINNKFGSLFNTFINLRSNYQSKNNKNHDLLLASTSCTQGLVQLSLSIDKLIQRAKPSCNATLTNETPPGGEILEAGIINHYFNNLSEVFSVLTLNLSSNSKLVQSIETFKRGGPAPGLAFGWGAPGGGFWSVRFTLTRLESTLILDLIEIFTVLPSRVEMEIDKGFLKRVNSVLEVCLTVGPTDRDILEKGIEILNGKSVLKYLEFCINYFIHQNEIMGGELKLSDEEFSSFSEVLISHFKARWLEIKKKKSENEDEKFGAMETIHEETELNEEGLGLCDSLVVEWAGQRLPVPIHWILSPIFGTGETLNSGLFLLLGFESIAPICNSISPISEIPLVWKLHALSFCLYKCYDVLEEKTRAVFVILQDIYNREIEKARNLDFEGEISENYSTFVENLIEQFMADSFGDVLYGRQVAVYLNNKVDVKLRLKTWNKLASIKVLHLLPPLENCLGGSNGYLGPIEENDGILKAYVQQWINEGLDKAFERKSMAFSLASYHLSCFIFQSDSVRQILRNEMAKSLLRYHSKKPHNEGMMRSFIESGLDVKQEQLYRYEIGRRFEVLKDCCEGNSELLIEVGKLRSLIS
ncbi:hypothetical protein LUZ60_012354 [Juncus effusus]|nr:hypothetical protein LUZ60_012354 [Juncus effusus]